jgi:ABC-2 type transport system ATP-binding protein
MSGRRGMAYIDVQELVKEFRVHKRKKGFGSSVVSLVSREYTRITAVDRISFRIDRGELVGYIGPNGAGKSTTIKILTGILRPTSGKVTVAGRVPSENRRENALHIGVVFGQRSQLYWDLPMEETFDLYARMYHVEEKRFRRNVEFFNELLEMSDYRRTPVRQLSLGQKMRAELAIAFLHDPEIVYLDEPTIGLDVLAKSRIRRFIREINRERRTTVILTTHDMDDIDQICDRLIMIDKGSIVHDGPIDSFKASYGSERMIIADFMEENVHLEPKGFRIVKEEGTQKHLVFDSRSNNAAQIIGSLMGSHRIRDLRLKEPSIEEIVVGIYESRASKHASGPLEP